MSFHGAMLYGLPITRHDAVEDTEISLADVEAEFGKDVAYLVDGVTKLDRVQFDTKEQQQSATMRKMMVAIAQDLRCIRTQPSANAGDETLGRLTATYQMQAATRIRDLTQAVR